MFEAEQKISSERQSLAHSAMCTKLTADKGPIAVHCVARSRKPMKTINPLTENQLPLSKQTQANF